jgi:hypothetical protein
MKKTKKEERMNLWVEVEVFFLVVQGRSVHTPDVAGGIHRSHCCMMGHSDSRLNSSQIDASTPIRCICAYMEREH